jgi:hypothetical protein
LETGEVVNTVQQIECGKNKNCVDEMFAKFTMNKLYDCWYNPSEPKTLSMTNQYTTWKMVLLGIFSGVTGVPLISVGVILLLLVVAFIKAKRSQYSELQ